MFEFLKKLEDPNRPLLGPNVKILQFWGLLLPENVCSRRAYISTHLFLVVIVFTTYIDLWQIKDDLSLVLLNLKISMLGTLSLFKTFTFLIWQKDWWRVIDYVTKADTACRTTNRDPVRLEMINNYTKYSRKLTYIYVTLSFTTTILVVCQPLFMYISSSTYRHNIKNGTENLLHIVSAWMPFDKNTLPGYIVASVIEISSTIYGAGWITAFDSNVFVLMIFIKAELEIIRYDCAKIFGSEKSPMPDNEAVERLKNCQKRHIQLIECVQVLNSCLSPNMLLYMIVCSVMLCVKAYQITHEFDMMQRLMSAEYFVFGISQLFIYCWLSTGVYCASLRLSLGPYESIWWNRSASQKKILYILTAQFRQTIVFSVGPFTELTMNICINILKGAYSYYTLLNSI